MGKILDTISPDLKHWLEAQPVFFVATAPLAGAGHVNCSPKGGDTFRVLGEREVAYLDLTGSGIETIAHVQENGRIVLMFCAFSGPPKIARLHGVGTVVYRNDPQFGDLASLFPPQLGARAIIRVAVTRVSTSCGFGVPRMELIAPRDELDHWSRKKGPEGLAEYRKEKNSLSLDELTGYRSPRSPRAPSM
jgi:hypothetical protein